ncbi:MAG: hypothetical protein IJ149_02915 [Oscillospiraceae bacterium]|nr:hypothetical protein [Oscillospiraceae bacterium]
MANIKFTDKQIKLLESLGLPTVLNENTPSEVLETFVDTVGDHLQLHGLTDDGENEIGKLCGDILTAIAPL